MDSSMDKMAIGAIGAQGFQQNWICLAVKIASRDSPSELTSLA